MTRRSLLLTLFVALATASLARPVTGRGLSVSPEARLDSSVGGGARSERGDDEAPVDRDPCEGESGPEDTGPEDPADGELLLAVAAPLLPALMVVAHPSAQLPFPVTCDDGGGVFRPPEGSRG